ncbi:helix-turn-helix domain-containing protein [Cohnella yongneupensis]|uniref:Helix-turn-helix domain-containing protein n=1 Tax=Cohnella yongneupensis TaxID=425006 RepID=A0ABW0R4A0_9BACL
MSDRESVQRAIDYIEALLEEEIELSAIAAEAFLSIAQLYRAFYALTGHPVKDYVRKRRTSVAAGQLRYTQRSVEAIAWDSRFESYAAFAKAFKKLVGMTPAAYRRSDVFYSFEAIRLNEQVAYVEDREQSERFPDVKVVRLPPEKMLTYLHVSTQEAGIENEAFQVVYDKLYGGETSSREHPKIRLFGSNVDLQINGEARFGYRILASGCERLPGDRDFEATSFEGGLYAMSKVAATAPDIVQGGWNRLLAEWLPKSTFELGEHPAIEQFVAYGRNVARMNLYLPVRKKSVSESIIVVELPEQDAIYSRGCGYEAQANAEREFITWQRQRSERRDMPDEGRYYLSYHYGASGTDEYWWENGVIEAVYSDRIASNLAVKRLGAGAYAACKTRAYGMLTGVLERMHRWIDGSRDYRVDEQRQWFASYEPVAGKDVERDSVVTIYIPVR